MADIFISYDSDDLSRVEPIAAALEKQNWSVFWARKIPAGKDWQQTISNALDDARLVISIWSKHPSIQGGYSKKQIVVLNDIY